MPCTFFFCLLARVFHCLTIAVTFSDSSLFYFISVFLPTLLPHPDFLSDFCPLMVYPMLRALTWRCFISGFDYSNSFSICPTFSIVDFHYLPSCLSLACQLFLQVNIFQVNDFLFHSPCCTAKEGLQTERRASFHLSAAGLP